MKEALVILLVIAVLIGLTAFRYRRQIAAMLQIWRMLKSMRQAARPGENRIDSSGQAKDTRLVNCAKCGTWVPEANAIKLPGSYFCSASCLESKVPAG
jgi:hypothetical protein